MKEQELIVPKTAKYFTLGKMNAPKVILALHGYGQLARYFINRFKGMDSDVLIVAPQGLSTFYLEGYEGRVGASWMTKEDRLLEINDYIGYLNLLMGKISHDNPDAEYFLLGFSQGCATASRFFCHSELRFKRLILCSGMPAHDISDALWACNLTNELIFVQGKQDSWRPETEYASMKENFSKMGIKFEEYWFEGGHEINAEILKDLSL